MFQFDIYQNPKTIFHQVYHCRFNEITSSYFHSYFIPVFRPHNASTPVSGIFPKINDTKEIRIMEMVQFRVVSRVINRVPTI